MKEENTALDTETKMLDFFSTVGERSFTGEFFKAKADLRDVMELNRRFEFLITALEKQLQEKDEALAKANERISFLRKELRLAKIHKKPEQLPDLGFGDH